MKYIIWSTIHTVLGTMNIIVFTKAGYMFNMAVAATSFLFAILNVVAYGTGKKNFVD